MASSKQLKGQLEKLKARIDTRQAELTELKNKHKQVRADLADAKQAEKDKAAKGK